MQYLAVAIANSFLDIAESAGAPVDPMKLQKLVYFGHGWYLGYEARALSAENAQAWRWGPVFPELYHEVKRWGSGPIMKSATVFSGFEDGKLRWNAPKIPPEDIFAHKLIQRVWEVYGYMSGLALSQLTHDPDGPWYRIWSENAGARNAEIPNRIIGEYFAQKIQANAKNT